MMPESAQPHASPWLTVKQASDYLQCGPRVIYSAIALGRLRAATIGGGRSFRLRREWLDEYAEARATPVELPR